MKQQSNIVHTSKLGWESDGHGDHAVERRYLARETGGQQIGTSMYRLAPGKKDWPLHFHHANEEAIYVLEGQGTLRMPSGDHAIAAGDYAHFQRTAAHAHQIVNTGIDDLVFLCISGMVAPDVTEYPEEGKLGVFCGGAPGTPDGDRSINEIHRRSNAVGYWE